MKILEALLIMMLGVALYQGPVPALQAIDHMISHTIERAGEKR